MTEDGYKLSCDSVWKHINMKHYINIKLNTVSKMRWQVTWVCRVLVGIVTHRLCPHPGPMLKEFDHNHPLVTISDDEID